MKKSLTILVIALVLLYGFRVFAAGIQADEIDCTGFELAKPGSNSELRCGDFYTYVDPKAKTKAILVSYISLTTNQLSQKLLPIERPVGEVPFSSGNLDREILNALSSSGTNILDLKKVSVTAVRMDRSSKVYGERMSSKSIGTLNLPNEKFEKIIHLEDFKVYCVSMEPMIRNVNSKLCIFENAECVGKESERDGEVYLSGTIMCAMDKKNQCPFFASECLRMKTNVDAFPDGFEYLTKETYFNAQNVIFDSMKSLSRPAKAKEKATE